MYASQIAKFVVVHGGRSSHRAFLRDFQARRNCLFLDCEREGIADLILIGVPILTVSLHFFQVLDDLVEVSTSDLVWMRDLTPFSSWPNERIFVRLFRPFRGFPRPILEGIPMSITLIGMNRGDPWFVCLLSLWSDYCQLYLYCWSFWCWSCSGAH